MLFIARMNTYSCVAYGDEVLQCSPGRK